MNSKTTLIAGVLIILFSAGGFIAGRMTAPLTGKRSEIAKQQNNNTFIEQREGGFKYINPLWECDNFNPSELNTIVQMRTDLNEYIQQVLNSKKAVHVSVYFRDLNSGPWLGINEKVNFSPASLLKVPIMIAALKKAEKDPNFLQKSIHYAYYRDDEVRPNIVDEDMLKIGNSYAMEDLIFRMIVHSDNQAKELIVENIEYDLFVKVIRDIGVDISGMTAADDFISVKDYSAFFRLLYNATYLSKELSEKALEILSQSSYDYGIVAGLPQGMTVASKFGERAFTDSDIKQLHDCGIVYHPGSPYLICVMTRGYEFKRLAIIISDVSSIVYKNVSGVS